MSTIREALESAFEASEAAADTPAPEAAAVDATPAEAAPAPEAEAAPVEAEAKPDRARDDVGRFAKAPKAKPEAVKPTAPVKPTQPATAAPQATAPAAPKPTAPAEAPLRAPQSWTPAEREHFAKLPQEAQRAIARQDAEVQKVMRESAPARRFHEAFNQLTTPYAPLLAGTQPLQAIGSMLQTVATLATGSQQQKAGLVAGLIKSYGVDINHLASALDGQPQAQGQAGAPVDAQAIYRQVHQQLMADFTRQAQQRQAASADAEVAKFAQTHEFLDDVAEEMAGLMDAAARRGRELSYEDAYAMACRAHPDVSKVVAQREAAAAATATQAATQRAKAAASSVKTQPAALPNGTERRTLRTALEDAWEQHSGR